MINQKNLLESKKHIQKNGGAVDMCKAIEDMIEEGKSEGKLEEKIEGVLRQKKKGYAIDDIADNVDMEVVSVREIIELSKKNPAITSEEIIQKLPCL